MLNKSTRIDLRGFWKNYDTRIVFVILLVSFLLYAVFIAFTLEPGIIPDEKRHFAVSKEFSKTIGVPDDVPETLKENAIIEQNPNLYYWLNGRIINLINLFQPGANDWELLVDLRALNVLYALGTVIICYFFSKQLVKNKWWQLLPVFLLTNTIMFVFLAGGVNDDNLVHLFSIAALYFLVRILNHQKFVNNSLALLIFLTANTLIKTRVFPFVFAIGVVWLVYIIRNRKEITPLKSRGFSTLLLATILVGLIVGNLALYGKNLVLYRSFLPPNEAVLTQEEDAYRIATIDERDPYHTAKRYQWEYLTIPESKALGYPGPIEYFFVFYIPNLFNRIFGVTAHREYFSVIVTYLHLILFFWLVLIGAIYFRDYSFKVLALLGILIFYSMVLFSQIYEYDLLLRFNYVYIQGRYMFSVINIPFVLTAMILENLNRKLIRNLSLVLLLSLYFISGPLTFILKFSSVFSDWLIF